MCDEKRVDVEGLFHSYGNRQALVDVTFSVAAREIVGFLGPNGGGKTSLFNILTTLAPIREGTVRLLGRDLADEASSVRRYLGVVFQSPSLDSSLSVSENLRHHGNLYGLSGRSLKRRIDEVLEQFDIEDRAKDMVQTLSGGLQRRAELAKAILHRPPLLLLDEPSSGLDALVRRRIWGYMDALRHSDDVTIVLTTHILDEAEMCDRVGIMDAGVLVALEAPDVLKSRVRGDAVYIDAYVPELLCRKLAERFACNPVVVGKSVCVECQNGHEFVRDFVSEFSEEVRSVRFGKPTLEDVFMKLTGHSFKEDRGEP